MEKTENEKVSIQELKQILKTAGYSIK